MRPLQWWRNRLLRVLLVFILTTLGTMLGMYVGGWEIVTRLFGGRGRMRRGLAPR